MPQIDQPKARYTADQLQRLCAMLGGSVYIENFCGGTLYTGVGIARVVVRTDGSALASFETGGGAAPAHYRPIDVAEFFSEAIRWRPAVRALLGIQ